MQVHFEPDGIFAPGRVTGAITPNGATAASGRSGAGVFEATAAIRSFAREASDGRMYDRTRSSSSTNPCTCLLLLLLCFFFFFFFFFFIFFFFPLQQLLHTELNYCMWCMHSFSRYLRPLPSLSLSLARARARARALSLPLFLALSRACATSATACSTTRPHCRLHPLGHERFGGGQGCRQGAERAGRGWGRHVSVSVVGAA